MTEQSNGQVEDWTGGETRAAAEPQQAGTAQNGGPYDGLQGESDDVQSEAGAGDGEGTGAAE